jgi:hypothetical protein
MSKLSPELGIGNTLWPLVRHQERGAVADGAPGGK